MNLNEIYDFVGKEEIVFLTYGGFLSQPLISGMMDALEKENLSNNINISMSNSIFTIFIELSQNMMKYSKTKEMDCDAFDPKGLILVRKDTNKNYYIDCQNIVSLEDKNKIEPIVNEIKTMSLDEIKQKYRELRRSGDKTHSKGGGIGFYEISKRCDRIDFGFKEINKNKFYFFCKTVILNKLLGK